MRPIDNHCVSKAGKRNKGVSTIIGMTIFFALFALTVSYSLIYTQYVSNNAAAVVAETEFENQRAAEILQVTTINATNINVVNPTTQPITIVQIWNSTHNQNLTVAQIVPPLSNYYISNLTSTDGYFKLITQMGNIFYSLSEPKANQSVTINFFASKSWNVTYWVNNPNNIVGTASLSDLSFSMNYVNSSWGVVNVTKFGFNASTSIKPNANIVNVSISLFSPLIPQNPGTSIVKITLNNTNQTIYSSGFMSFLGMSQSSTYPMQIDASFTTSQTITVTIVGADFA